MEDNDYDDDLVGEGDVNDDESETIVIRPCTGPILEELTRLVPLLVIINHSW